MVVVLFFERKLNIFLVIDNPCANCECKGVKRKIGWWYQLCWSLFYEVDVIKFWKKLMIITSEMNLLFL